MMISLISCVTHAELIEVFTTKAYPVALNGLQAVVCELDALNHWNHELTQLTPQMASTPQAIAFWNARLSVFYRCKHKASLYALSSLPAIVIDKTYVAYGLRSVDYALIASRHQKEVHHA